MTAISFTPPPVLIPLTEDLNKNPLDLETKKKLYYVAAVVSAIAAATFLVASFFAFQTITTPFWIGLAGPIVAQAVGYMFATLTGKMIENARETNSIANRVKAIQTVYKNHKNTPLSTSEKIIIAHRSFAEEQYVKVKNHLEKLIKNIDHLDKSRIEEIIFLEHELLILKINLAFMSTLFDICVTDRLSNITEQKDVLVISDQDPLIRNQIQGLNNLQLSLPFVCFTKDPSKNLSYNEVKEMHAEDLARHIFTVIETAHSAD